MQSRDHSCLQHDLWWTKRGCRQKNKRGQVKCQLSTLTWSNANWFLFAESLCSFHWKCYTLLNSQLRCSCHAASFHASYHHSMHHIIIFTLRVSVTLSTEMPWQITTSPESTKSRNSESSESRGTNSNLDFGLIWICTGESEFLDLVDFGGAAFVVESVIYLSQIGRLNSVHKVNCVASLGRCIDTLPLYWLLVEVGM